MTPQVTYSHPWLTVSYAWPIVAVVRELPDARWNERDKTWRVLATPLAAALLRDAGAELSHEALWLCGEYDRSQEPQPVEIDWGTSPWPHQARGAEWLAGRYAGMLAYGMGAGKSLTTIGAISGWGAKRVLILCPRSVIGVWRREFARHYPGAIDMVCLDDDRPTKSKAARYWRHRASYDLACQDSLHVCVINYESAWREPLGKTLVGHEWDVLVLDESHRVKSPTGKAAKYCAQLALRARRRVCLTGTPMPHSPLDIWSQMRVVEPAVLGTSFARFRAKYAVCHPVYPSKILRWKEQDELARKIEPWVLRVKTEDVVSLPGITHSVVGFQLAPKAQQIYESMEKEMFARLDDGEEVSAANVLVKLLRLQQITSGRIDEHTIGSEKSDTLLDLLGDVPAEEPVVVFARFREDLAELKKIAEKLGRTYGEISGTRRDLTEHATMPEGIGLMAVQQQSGGVGIDLTGASIGVWYSLGFSLGDYDQAIARLYRPGQPKPVAMYHLVAEKTVDEVVYDALAMRRDVVEVVLSQLQEKVQ